MAASASLKDWAESDLCNRKRVGEWQVPGHMVLFRFIRTSYERSNKLQ